MRGDEILTSSSSGAELSTSPAMVYDNVTKAWERLLGTDLHFGYFDSPEDPLSRATENLTRRLANAVQLRRDGRVLDVGCGIGGPACFLAQESGCRVTGISTSQVGVQIATSKAVANGLSPCAEFLVRDAMDNQLPAEFFDCIWIMESSHLMERKDLLFAESVRVLRSGGLLVLCDVMLRKAIPFQYLVRNLADFENLNSVFGKQHVELLETYVQIAEANALRVLKTEDISEAVLPTLDHWAHNTELHRSEVAELVGEEYGRRFGRACGFLQRLWSEEKLGYGILLAEKRAW